MNDLTISKQFTETFPTIAEGLKKAQNVFNSIHSFEDIEATFLKGAGLSPNTYRSYLQAVKEFYEYTNHLNPLQVQPRHIEAFYDYLIKRVDRNTAYMRIRGLKRFFAGIRQIIPFYTSPFEIMADRLIKKLNRTKKGNRTRKALSKAALKRVLEAVKDDKGLYAIIYMLATSGLRASELLQLHWKDLVLNEGVWTAYFIGKGDREAEQELYAPAVVAAHEYFIETKHRKPTYDDYLFYTEDGERPLQYPALWARFKKLGRELKEKGVILSNIVFSPHLLRRTYATCLYKSGMGIKAIQAKTRHASVETLMKHYIDDTEPASPYLKAIFA